jgi:hypothetical protein
VIKLMPHCHLGAVNVQQALAFTGSPLALNPIQIIKTASVVFGFQLGRLFGLTAAWAKPDLTSVWAVVGLALITGFSATCILVLVRKVRDPFVVGLCALGLALLGGAMLIGLVRSATFDIIVAYESRYAVAATFFWLVCLGLLLRWLSTVKARLTQSAFTAAWAGLLMAASTGLLPNFVAAREYYAAAASAVAQASSDKRFGQVLRGYLAMEGWVMTPIPALRAGGMDIFRGMPVLGEKREKPLLICLGAAFLRGQFHDGGVSTGVEGWIAGPRREARSAVYAVRDNHLAGVLYPAQLATPRSRHEIEQLMHGMRRMIYRWAPQVAEAHGINVGWTGVALGAPGAGGLFLVGVTPSGETCRLELPK